MSAAVGVPNRDRIAEALVDVLLWAEEMGILDDLPTDEEFAALELESAEIARRYMDTGQLSYPDSRTVPAVCQKLKA